MIACISWQAAAARAWATGGRTIRINGVWYA